MRPAAARTGLGATAIFGAILAGTATATAGASGTVAPAAYGVGGRIAAITIALVALAIDGAIAIVSLAITASADF